MFRLLTLLMLLLYSVVLFGQKVNQDSVNRDNSNQLDVLFNDLFAKYRIPPSPPRGNSPYRQVMNMPSYNCNSVKNDRLEKAKCHLQNMLSLKYINASFEYPNLSTDEEGIVQISFLVGKDGSLSHFNTWRNDLNEECATVFINILKSTNGLWNAGTQRDIPVSVQMIAEMRFFGDNTKRTEHRKFIKSILSQDISLPNEKYYINNYGGDEVYEILN